MHQGKERAIRYLIDIGDLALTDGVELTTAIINPKENPVDPNVKHSSVFIITGTDSVAVAACAPASMTPDEVTAAVNAQQPGGGAREWAVAAEADLPDDFTGSPYPGVCSNADRRHYLLRGWTRRP